MRLTLGVRIVAGLVSLLPLMNLGSLTDMRMTKEDKEKMLRGFVEDLLRMEQLNFKEKSHIFKSDLEPGFWRAPFSWLRRGKKEEESQEWKELGKKIAIFYSDFADRLSRIDPEEILRIDLERDRSLPEGIFKAEIESPRSQRTEDTER